MSSFQLLYNVCANTGAWLFFFRYWTAAISMINIFDRKNGEKRLKIAYALKIVGLSTAVLFPLSLYTLVLDSEYQFYHGDYSQFWRNYYVGVGLTLIFSSFDLLVMLSLVFAICKVYKITKKVPALSISNKKVIMHLSAITGILILREVMLFFWWFDTKGYYIVWCVYNVFLVFHVTFIMYMLIKFG